MLFLDLERPTGPLLSLWQQWQGAINFMWALSLSTSIIIGLNGSMLNFVHYFNSAVLWYINDWISMFIVKNKASGFYFGELINLLCKMQLCCCHLCIRKSPFNRWTAISVTSSTCWTAMGCLLLSYIIHIKHFPQKKRKHME